MRLHPAVAQRDGVRGRVGRLAPAGEEDEAGLADRHAVAVRERVLAHRAPVDEGAVEAVEVGEHEALARAPDRAVAAREQRVREPHAVRGVAPDGQRLRAQLEGRALQRPRDEDDSRVHDSERQISLRRSKVTTLPRAARTNPSDSRLSFRIARARPARRRCPLPRGPSLSPKSAALKRFDSPAAPEVSPRRRAARRLS